MYSNRLFLLVLALLWVSNLRAQWNAIAGYDISNADAGAYNRILHDFNKAYDNSKPFTDIKVLHGFTAGLRYQYRLGAFELAYNRRFTRRIGDDFNIENDITTRTNADFFYEIRTFSYTAEFGGALRLGASIDYNTYLTEMKYAQTRYKDFKIKQHNVGSHVYLGTHIANRDNLSFSVRAYYQFIWDDLSARSLRERLKLLDDECLDCKLSPGTFGLAIIINNGPQRK